ncbi:MAG TPA: hypothetical protein VGS19_15770 [Streptosporangiaceae bacterium]|nr:hypothetical protein [Streptosporangiaceae bacterium]
MSDDGKRLVLARMQLTAVPDWLGNLTALTRLDLSENLLTAVPDRGSADVSPAQVTREQFIDGEPDCSYPRSDASFPHGRGYLEHDHEKYTAR